MRRTAGAFRHAGAGVANDSGALADPARGQRNRPGGADALGWGPARPEHDMARLLGITGSLRAGSFNTALLRNAQAMLPAGSTLELATLHGIPLYDGDAEAREGLPPAVVALKEKVIACDGLLLATPEYNNGIPGVFKNGIDWLSRPNADIGKVFGGRKVAVAVIGASPGGFGTVLSQAHWLPVLKTLGVRLWAGNRLMVSRAGSVFDADGRLVDDKVRGQLAGFVQGFAAFAAAPRD